MDLIRPRGTELRTVTPCSIPSNFKSSTYSAAPVTFFRPSLRGIDLPTRVMEVASYLDRHMRYSGYFARMHSLRVAGDARGIARAPAGNARFVGAQAGRCLHAF